MFTKRNPAIQVAKIADAALTLTGMRIAVIGGTNGLGRAIANAAHARGATVTVVGRSNRDPHLNFLAYDLSLVSSAKRVAAELPEVDALVFTTGILPGNTRVTSAEGIEIDMAISALSRAVIMRDMAPKLKANGRVFIMGFPGNNQKADLNDLNSDRSYVGGLGQAHSNTVAVNEALVFHYAQALRDRPVGVYGLNPGLIKTTIREPMHGGSWLGNMMEGFLGLFNSTPEQYAMNVLPLLIAPELTAHSGAMFGQDGVAVLPSKEFADAAVVGTYMRGVDDLIARAEGAAARGV